MRLLRWSCALAAGASLLAQSVMLPTPGDRAREAVGWLLHAEYQKLYDASAPSMQQAMPVEAWKSRVSPMLASLGKLVELGPGTPALVQGNTVVTLPAKFERAALEFTVSVAPDGRITGLFLHPPKPAATPYAAPAYAAAGAFTAHEVTVGDGEWKLPGTLLLPRAMAPVPAVVLVHGSGPNDRDETVLANKPFRDLAEGLAARGVAVLRYDKRTLVYSAKAAQTKDFTVREETVDDAVLAVNLVCTLPGIDAKRVFVLGHSLGGYLLPLILRQAPDAAGGIALAGATRPLEDLMVEQFEYLVPLQSAGSGELKKAGDEKLAEVRAGAAEVKALTPAGKDGPPVLGAPRSYWLGLKDYNPPALAAKLPCPLLILQGERDYQVSMRDFANWKAALGERKDVTLKSYPTLNHLFMEGTGKSTPAEYSKPDHVSAAVVNDIAVWVLAH